MEKLDATNDCRFLHVGIRVLNSNIDGLTHVFNDAIKLEGAEGTESETADLAIDALQVHEEGVDSKDCEFLILLSVVGQVEVDHLLHD